MFLPKEVKDGYLQDAANFITMLGYDAHFDGDKVIIGEDTIHASLMGNAIAISPKRRMNLGYITNNASVGHGYVDNFRRYI